MTLKAQLLKGNWAKGNGLKALFPLSATATPVIPKAPLLSPWKLPRPDNTILRISYQPHPNRGKSVPVEVTTGDKTIKMISIVNMTQKPSFENGFHSVGKITLRKGQKVLVHLSAKGSKGNVHVDAARLVPVD